MPQISIGALLKSTNEFERRLEKFYISVRDGTEDSGVRLLTYYLARHCHHLKQVLDNLTLYEIDSICKEHVECELDIGSVRHLQLMTADPKEAHGKELLECAVTRDEALIGRYRSILEQPLSEGAASLFESLILIEEADVVMLKKMMATNYF